MPELPGRERMEQKRAERTGLPDVQGIRGGQDERRGVHGAGMESEEGSMILGKLWCRWRGHKWSKSFLRDTHHVKQCRRCKLVAPVKRRKPKGAT